MHDPRGRSFIPAAPFSELREISDMAGRSQQLGAIRKSILRLVANFRSWREVDELTRARSSLVGALLASHAKPLS